MGSHYLQLSVGLITVATLDLWLEGAWGGGEEHVVWQSVDVPLDLHRYHYDQRYADLINRHVKRAVEQLGAEIAEIDRMTPEDIRDDWTNCE